MKKSREDMSAAIDRMVSQVDCWAVMKGGDYKYLAMLVRAQCADVYPGTPAKRGVRE